MPSLPRTSRPVRRRTARVVGLLATVATAAVTSVAITAPADADSDPAARAACSSARVAAHRGSHDAHHTEDTRRSARLAATRHAYAVDGDLQLTRDGVWMLMHDSTVDRTTDGHGRVADLTSGQIKTFHTLDGVEGGVPSLEQFLTTMDAYPTTKLQIEIKPAMVSQAALRSLMHTFAAHKLAKRLMITSFHGEPLSAVRAGYSSAWQTGLISTSAVSVAQARPYGDKLIIEQSAISAGYVAQMHQAGFVVWAWTVDSKPRWQSVVSAGVNGVVTNKLLDTIGWCNGA